MPPNLGQVAATVWDNKVSPNPTDNVFLSQYLLMQLKASGQIKSADGGKTIEETVEYAENTTFRSYSDMESVDITRVDSFDAASYTWKEISVQIVISDIEAAKCSGKSAKIELLTAKINNAKNSHNAGLNRMLHSDGTGNGGKDPSGVKLIIATDPTTGTVGAINRATWSFWRNQQVSGTNSGTAYNNLRSAMRTAYNTASKGAAAEHPSYGWTDRTTFQAWEGLLTTNERFTNKKEGETEFMNEILKFKGCEMAFDEDAYAVTAEWRMVNKSALTLRYLKGLWMKRGEPIRPVNGYFDVIGVNSACQLTTNQSRRLAVVTAIT